MNESTNSQRFKFHLQSTTWVLMTILILGFGIRLWRFDDGLPSLLHPDESKYVEIAQNIFKTRDLNPHFFNYPSLFFYLNAISYGPYYLWGRMVGTFESPSDIPSPVLLGMGIGYTSMPSTFLLGRFLSILFGTGSIFLVFLIGRKAFSSPFAGLLAALMMALSPTNIGRCRLILPDTYVVFFVLLAFWACLKVFEKARYRDYLFAAITIGLAASTKYNGAIVGLCLIGAHFLKFGKKGFRDYRIYIAIILSPVFFLVFTPYALLDYSKFYSDFLSEAKHYSSGHAGMEGEALRFYLKYLLQVQTIVFLLALVAMGMAVAKRRKEHLLVMTFPVIYFCFISTFVVRNPRTLMPVLPFLFLLASSLIMEGFFWMRQRWPERKRTALVVVGIGVLLCLLPPMRINARSLLPRREPESQEVARQWIEENIPSGSKIAIESYSPYIDPEKYVIEVVFRMIDHPPEWYREQGFEYLVFSQSSFNRFIKNPDRYPEQAEDYENLFQNFLKIETFDYNKYQILIYSTQLIEFPQRYR